MENTEFKSEFILQEDISNNPEDIRSEYKNGLLKIYVPLKQEFFPKQIKIG